MNTNTLIFGCDLGDKNSEVCVMNSSGEVVDEFCVAMDEVSLEQEFKDRMVGQEGCVVVIEAGTHSPWVSRLFASIGLKVIVANPRHIPLLSKSAKKSDRNDAKLLAQIGLVSPSLLSPLQHRSLDAQKELLSIKVRKHLVQTRTALINSVRGCIKSFGLRIKKCDAAHFVEHANALSHSGELGSDLLKMITPMLVTMTVVNEQIDKLDDELSRKSDNCPAVRAMKQIAGVGPITALTFKHVIDNPKRFSKSRMVGPYLGLTRRTAQSGKSDPALGISKCGDAYMRTLLVNCAQRVLRDNSADSDLKRYGQNILNKSGKKTGRKRAIVAVARKMAVLMHRLWVSGEGYQAVGYHQARSAVAV